MKNDFLLYLRYNFAQELLSYHNVFPINVRNLNEDYKKYNLLFFATEKATICFIIHV